MTTTILIIVNVFAALAIIVLALMQQSKGDMGSAFGGGGSQSMFGSRGSANFLSRLTAIMCAVFFISSLSLAYLYAKRAESSSVVGGNSVIQSSEVPTIDEQEPSIDTGVPTIGEDENEAPSTDAEIPSIEGGEQAAVVDAAEQAVEDVSDAANEAVEAVSEEIPAVPEQ